MDPRALDELLPDWRDGAPVESPVTGDQLWFLTTGGKIKAPFVPPPLRNAGKYVASLQKMSKWLGDKAEEAGAQVFPGLSRARSCSGTRDRVIGVRTGDKGLDHDGQPKSNYEPGADILAKVVVLGEGPRGTLPNRRSRLGLDEGRQPASLCRGRQRALAASRRSV